MRAVIKKKNLEFDPMIDAQRQIATHREDFLNDYLKSEFDQKIKEYLKPIVKSILVEYEEEWTPLLRELPETEVREEILHYLSKHGSAYPSEIADALRIHYDIICNVMSNLVKEGFIEKSREE